MINVLGPFPSLCNHEIFVKLNLSIFVLLVGQREKSQKYFDPSAFYLNLNDSNPCSSLGVMNFQKWELFSGSPGILDDQQIIQPLIKFCKMTS